MMSCINCGSSAQLKLIDSVTISDMVRETYECGCGCITQRYSKIVRTMCYDKDGHVIGTIIDGCRC